MEGSSVADRGSDRSPDNSLIALRTPERRAWWLERALVASE